MNEQVKKRVVWIIDDSPTDSARVSKALNQEYETEIFPDGAAAVERLASKTLPDLLLIDWMMPGLSGIEVCQFVRASKGGAAKLPIILLTAQHGTDEIVEALNSGANDYISKPFVDQELKARVRNLITTKTLLERAENAEADVSSLLMNAPDPIFAVDKAGSVTFANDAALDALRVQMDSIAGKPVDQVLPGLSFNTMLERLKKCSVPLADLTIGDRLFSPSIRDLPSGGATATTISLRDVTERRNADARRLDFYSIIAHDLRTPLTSALMRLQFALRGKHGVLPMGLITDLEKVDSGLKSQVSMVNDFLELARLEGAGYRIEKSPIDMSDLILTTMDDFQPLLDKNRIQWNHIAPDTKTYALGDPQRMNQVLTNLIGNAIKFMTGAGTITTTVEIKGGEVLTTIRDTGRGIAAGDIPNLFDRFTRVKESSSDVIGSGLGLMIVREIVNAHQGQIGVRSELGVGSEFWFSLPLAAAD